MSACAFKRFLDLQEKTKKSRSNKQINFLSLRRTFLAPPGMMSGTLVGNHNTPYWEVGYLCTLSWVPSTILELMTSNEFRVKTVNSEHINQSLCSLQQFLRDMPLMSKRLVFDKHFKRSNVWGLGQGCCYCCPTQSWFVFPPSSYTLPKSQTTELVFKRS